MTDSQRASLARITKLAPWRASASARTAAVEGAFARRADNVGRKPPRQPSPAGQSVAWWVLACSGLIPVLLTAGYLIAGAVQPASYSPMRQTVSVLAGHAGVHRWIVTLSLIAVGPCYFAVAAGLTGLRMSARIGLLVSGAASIGIGLSPEPVVGTTTQHMAFTSIGAASIAVWPALTAQREPQVSILTSPQVAAAITGAFLAMLGWLVVEAHGGSALGMVERLDSSIQVLWPFLVALTLRNAATSRVVTFGTVSRAVR